MKLPASCYIPQNILACTVHMQAACVCTLFSSKFMIFRQNMGKGFFRFSYFVSASLLWFSRGVKSKGFLDSRRGVCWREIYRDCEERSKKSEEVLLCLSNFMYHINASVAFLYFFTPFFVYLFLLIPFSRFLTFSFFWIRQLGKTPPE